MRKPRSKARKEALASGAPRFWTGEPCRNGHIDWRLTSNGTCLQCATLSRERRRDKNPTGYYVGGPCKNGHLSKRSINGHCYECALATHREWSKANSEWNNAYGMKLRKADPDRAREKSREASQRRRADPKCREQDRVRLSAKYRDDIQHRLSVILRNRLNRVVKRGQGKKAGSAIRDLGCTLPELREHIASQFANGMSWENWGPVWQLDHVRPLDSFDLSVTEQFLMAFHYTNLQPLLAEDNRAKSNHYDPLKPWVSLKAA